ncbi:transporter MCH4 [Diaporthe amygdali]|uniref:transporter MCH4 n=1 Tax=Phomopsis amygdali TaxID=1214568 RepID=UPI0022FE0E3A|nr:transporter MCH4 [Diaporthe amygdali]KAJ0119645.1 transporter MCH4 [Diaporthe amygdali]
MDSSRASSSIQLIQLPNIGQQDAEQAVQSSQRPIAAGELLGETIEEQLPPRPDPIPVPETSAKAWLSVAGAFFYLFPTYGKREQRGRLYDVQFANTTIGWITGLYTSLALLLGIQFGPLFDAYGPRLLGPIGCAIYIPVFFVLAECTQYWHFMLTISVWGGFGAAIISTIGVAVIGKWFVKRRGLAMGIALCGSSTGGIVMPLMLRSLLPRLGWAWTIRILAFINMAVLIAGSLCLQQPLPQQISAASEQRRRKRIALNFMALTSNTFTLITLGIFALEFAMFGVFGLLPTYATAANFPASTGYALVAISNGCSTFGRLLPGLAGDYFGHFNVLVCMILCTAAFTGAILVPFGSSSLKALYIFSALWGFGSGSFISLTPVCMGKTCETEDYGRYYGTMYFFVSFSLLLTVPLGGQMLSTFGTRALAGLYVGIVLAGGVCFLSARQLIYGKRGFGLKAKI